MSDGSDQNLALIFSIMYDNYVIIQYLCVKYTSISTTLALS